MREIKFKGKSINTNEWVYGSLICDEDKCWIVEETCYVNNLKKSEYWITIEVIPETVGQFTGLKDRNGKEIYEGDILSRKNLKYIVEWSSNHMFVLTVDNMEVGMLCEFSIDMYEIVGNIYENPELFSNR